MMEKYTGGHPYFILVGLIHPRKNLTNLFKAYDLFRRNIQSDATFGCCRRKKMVDKGYAGCL